MGVVMRDQRRLPLGWWNWICAFATDVGGIGFRVDPDGHGHLWTEDYMIEATIHRQDCGIVWQVRGPDGSQLQTGGGALRLAARECVAAMQAGRVSRLLERHADDPSLRFRQRQAVMS